ncbi:MAG: DUF2934 domain-containing protein [Amaricoccus sp.]
MTSTDLEQRIRDRAHQIWEAEGRPDGSQDRHWEQARLAIEAEERIGATDDGEDTELTSALATMPDPIDALEAGEAEPVAEAEPTAEPLAEAAPAPKPKAPRKPRAPRKAPVAPS